MDDLTDGDLLIVPLVARYHE